MGQKLDKLSTACAAIIEKLAESDTKYFDELTEDAMKQLDPSSATVVRLGLGILPSSLLISLSTRILSDLRRRPAFCKKFPSLFAEAKKNYGHGLTEEECEEALKRGAEEIVKKIWTKIKNEDHGQEMKKTIEQLDLTF